MLTSTRPKLYSDPCAGVEHCAHWITPDRDCGHLTEAHSPFCSEHADLDDAPWMQGHSAEDCCADCCPGDEVHHA